MNILDDNSTDNSILCHEVMDIAKAVLSERDLEIFVLYTVDNVSYKQLGKDYGITGNRVAQIIYRTLWKIRKAMVYTKTVWMPEYGYYKNVERNQLFDCESNVMSGIIIQRVGH